MGVFVARKNWYFDIHERLLADDPTASAELAENVLDQLVKSLTLKHRNINDKDIIYDAATEALISYIKNPKQFNPAKRGLLGYLKMAAEGDLRNILAKIKRRGQREILSNNVELTLYGGNITIGKGLIDESLDTRRELDKARKIINKLFHDLKDRKMMLLILQGERSTKEFSKILGITNKSIQEQRKIVKRNKDRLKKIMQRHFKKKI
jgi:hypothetical protein